MSFKASLLLHSFFQEIPFMAGFSLPRLFYRWLVLVLDFVFIIRDRDPDVERSGEALSHHRVNVPLSGVNRVLWKVFQRLNDGKG